MTFSLKLGSECYKIKEISYSNDNSFKKSLEITVAGQMITANPSRSQELGAHYPYYHYTYTDTYQQFQKNL